MNAFLSDVLAAARVMLRAPRFGVTVIIVMSLGMAASSAAVLLVTAVVRKPVTVDAPEELAYIRSGSTRGLGGISYENDFSALAAAVSPALVAVRGRDVGSLVDLETSRPVGQLLGEMVSANYFEVLRAKPMRGRVFTSSDDFGRHGRMLVISERLWRRHFAATPSIVGHRVVLDADLLGYPFGKTDAYLIVGVMADGFRGTLSPWLAPDYWVPFTIRATDYLCERPDFLSLPILTGIVRHPVDLPRSDVRSRVASTAVEVQKRLYSSRPDWSLVTLDNLESRLPFDELGSFNPSYVAGSVFAIGGVVLFVATLNVVGLMIARAFERRPQVALRMALGARNADMIRHFVAENALHCFIAGIVGVALAPLLVRLMLRSLPSALGGDWLSERVFSAGDLAVTIYIAAVLSAVMTLVFVTLSYGYARCAETRDLGPSAQTQRWPSRVLSLLLIPQVAVCTVLLAVASGAFRDLAATEWTERGYRTDGLTVAAVRAAEVPTCLRNSAAIADHVASNTNVYQALLERVAGNSEGRLATLTNALPTERFFARVISRDSYSQGEQKHILVARADVSPAFFEVLDIDLVRGGSFRGTNDNQQVVVSASLARLLWPNRSGVGEGLAFHDPESTRAPTWLSVVGVAEDIRPPDGSGFPGFRAYVPLGSNVKAKWLITTGAVNQIAPTLLNLSGDTQAALSLEQLTSMGELINRHTRGQRILTNVAAMTAFVGLLLATLGIHAIATLSIAQRSREIAIRLAVGANRLEVLRAVFQKDILGASIGGLAGAITYARIIRPAIGAETALPTLSRFDIVIVVVILVSATAIACAVPARSALRSNISCLLRD